MALLLKNGAVFLHVPKTGGNWVTEVLGKMDLVERQVGHKHADYDHFRRPTLPARRPVKAGKKFLSHMLRNRHEPSYLFCFVRNPLTWYESWFKYMSQESRQWKYWGSQHTDSWHPNSLLDGLGSSDFNTFVSNVINKRPGYVTEMFGWYTPPAVDFVGRQEHLREDLIVALDAMELDYDKKFVRDYHEVGVSRPRKVVVEWDSALKEAVTRLEYAGLVRYGYEG